jgi:hypothetical protein
MDHFWIDPAVGRMTGGEIVTVYVATARDLERAKVYFGDAAADIEETDSIRKLLRVKTPSHDATAAAQRDGVIQQTVRIVLAGGPEIVQGPPFIYLSDLDTATPPGRGWDAHPTAAIIAVGLLLSTQLFWSLKRLERQGRSREDAPPPHPIDGAGDAQGEFDAIRRLLDDHRRALDQLQSSLTGAVTDLPERVSKLVGVLKETVPPNGFASVPEPRQVLSFGAPQPGPKPKAEEPSRPPAAKSASKKVSSDAGAFTGERLAEMWNEIRRSAGTTQQLIASLNAAWSGNVVARASRGLIVVTSSDEECSWVLPSIQPLVHEATIQEFFEVRSPREGATPRLVRPANVPRGTDPHGFTAGQILRGVLEA